MQNYYTTERCSGNGSNGVTPLFWQAFEEYKRLEAMGGLERQSAEVLEQCFDGSQEAYWENVLDPQKMLEQYFHTHQPVVLAWAQKSAELAKEANTARLESVRRGMGYGNLQALFSWDFGACYIIREVSQAATAVYAPFPLGTATSEARGREYKSAPRRSHSSSSSGGDGGDGSGGSDPEPPASFVVPFPRNILSQNTHHAMVHGSQEGGWC